MIKAAQDDIQIIGESVMDIASSRIWHERLCASLAKKATHKVSLDMSAVEKIDTACLQLLVTFVLAATRKKLTVEWTARSERFLLAARSLNLNEVLSIPR